MNKAIERPKRSYVSTTKWVRKDIYKARERAEYRKWLESEEGQAKLSQTISILTNGYV